MSTLIVGGGISGLTLAHALLERGERDVRVLEAAPRLGGTMGTNQRGGFITEIGPNGFLDRDPSTLSLVQALGISDRLRAAAPTAKRRYVFTRGAVREVPSSPPKFLTSDILPLGARLRVLGELFSSRTDQEDESLASFAKRHLGERAAAVLVDAMQSGIFAGDPARLSLASTFPKMAALEQEHRSLILALIRLERAARREGKKASHEGDGAAAGTGAPSGTLWTLEGGLQTLVDTLARKLGPDRVHVRSTLTGMQMISPGRWQVQVTDAGGRTTLVETERLVLATPAHVSATLLESFDPAMATTLGAIPYAPIAAVHLGFDRGAFDDAPRAPEGFGFLVPHEEGGKVLGTMYISSIFPWRAPDGQTLVTCMMGGVRQRVLADFPDHELVQVARSELSRMLGWKALPIFSEVNRWTRGIPQYEVGHAEKLARLEASLSLSPGLVLHGNAYRGVGINDCVRESLALAERLVHV